MKMFVLYIFILVFVFSAKAQTQTVNDSTGVEDSLRIKITRLNINSSQSDFSPVLIQNELYFISGRPNNFGVMYANDSDKTETTDIYTAAKKDAIDFRRPKMLPVINSKYNEGPFALNLKDNIIYFSGNGIKTKKSDDSNKLKIYSSKKINGNWTKPQVMPFCKDGYAYCHPTISADGTMIVFSSNIPGGSGGMDLYITTFVNGQWTEPQNAGNKVNSSANELFPFLGQKNILFFSSNKPGGQGGLDLYSFDLEDSFDSEVLGLPAPLNSEADDFGICLDSTLESGYFSTNRIAKYSDDIYYFKTIIPDFSRSITPLVKNTFCYTFFEETTMQANDTANLTYEWNFGNGQKARALKVKHCFNAPGEYPIQLNVVEKNSGEVFYSEATYTLTVEEPEQLYIACCDTIVVGKDLQIGSARSRLKGYDIYQHYWRFGDGKYNFGKNVKHNFKKSGIYTVELGVLAKDQTTNKIEKFKIEKKIVVTGTI